VAVNGNRFWPGKLRIKHCLRDVGVEGRIILKWILEKESVKMSVELDCFCYCLYEMLNVAGIGGASGAV
jgi:hypothetical protein